MGNCLGNTANPPPKEQHQRPASSNEGKKNTANGFAAAAQEVADHFAARKEAEEALLLKSMSFNNGGAGQQQLVELRVFGVKELQKATQNFKEPDMLLGEGGFGKVYKGYIRNLDDTNPAADVSVAVKRLNPNSFQGQQEWLAEILLLGKLRHPNLVRLFGYCSEGGDGMLIYEYLAKGSLDYHLFPEGAELEGRPVLSWDTRLRIALDAASGLAHLHDNNVIHRDFKAPNILLDENFNAKLTDFGLAKGADTDQTHITTRIMGTMGYLDPKYMETGQLTKKSDVYAFGVMLLELLTGKRAMEQSQQGTPPLTAWASQYLNMRKPDIGALVDPALLDQFTTKAAQRAAHKLAISAKHCIEEDPSLRPLMSDMVETLRPMVQQALGLAHSGTLQQQLHLQQQQQLEQELATPPVSL
eukprot:TRINITY_DN6840_c1_g1_i1.p1 TRINITY_DN6840_c1_g1~~TRINITY_DN6840_c1_g1_i1.p1  ORF type:complete len:415 (-),score=126.58 TRINITY_DN6840_c1_g1_i1:86-1330(-)